MRLFKRPTTITESKRAISAPVYQSSALLAVLALAGATITYPDSPLKTLLPIAATLAVIFTILLVLSLTRRRLVVEPAQIAVTCNESHTPDAVLAELQVGVIVLTQEGQVTVFNRAAESMLGQTADTVIDRRIDQVDFHPLLAQILHVCLSSKTPQKSEMRIAGTPQRVVGAHAVFFGSGERSRVVITVTDLTEIRSFERSQREFVSYVGHELRTPITAVRSSAEALLRGGKNDHQVADRFLGNIIRESDRLTLIVEELTDLARMDAGLRHPQMGRASIADLVEVAAQSVRPLADNGGIELHTDIQHDLTAFCDENHILQAVRNLIDNAVKYSEPGGKVTVTADKCDDDVAIYVTDTGIGIPHADLDRIFERFYRVDKAASRMRGGTGLGLPIVKGLVESNGGTVAVNSKLGVGSTFTIRVPVEGKTATIQNPLDSHE